MKKIDIRDIRSEEILAVNRGENTLFQRRENLSKHTSMLPAANCHTGHPRGYACSGIQAT